MVYNYIPIAGCLFMFAEESNIIVIIIIEKLYNKLNVHMTTIHEELRRFAYIKTCAHKPST